MHEDIGLQSANWKSGKIIVYTRTNVNLLFDAFKIIEPRLSFFFFSFFHKFCSDYFKRKKMFVIVTSIISNFFLSSTSSPGFGRNVLMINDNKIFVSAHEQFHGPWTPQVKSLTHFLSYFIMKRGNLANHWVVHFIKEKSK